MADLRRSGVGCYIGGKFFGALGYADDIILLAPCRSAMQQMLTICENYGLKNNLQFSTDINPQKSKSKCIFMCGPLTRRYADPKPLKLYGKDLPWVSHATHLGHELSKDGTMELDANMKRGQFISNSMDIRSMFSFALPDQILKAVNVYCGHFLG